MNSFAYFKEKLTDPTTRETVLWDTLENLRSSGALPIVRKSLSRKKLQQTFHFPIHSLIFSSRNQHWKWARQVLDRYEIHLQKLGLYKSAWDARIPEIDQYLDRLNKSNQLPINNIGKLNRKAIIRQFSLSSKKVSVSAIQNRNPKLSELLDRYDREIAGQNHSQYSGDQYASKIEQIFLQDNVVFCTDQKRINKNWLSKVSGANKSQLLNTPSIIYLIQKKEQENFRLKTSIKTIKHFNVYGVAVLNVGVSPYSAIHGRFFDFSVLTNDYKITFVEKIATAALQRLNNLKSPKSSYYRYLHFFEWLADPKNGYLNVKQELEDKGNLASEAKYSLMCHVYQHSLIAEDKTKQKKAQSPNKKFSLESISYLGEAKILPKSNFPRRSKSNNRKAHIKTLVEAQSGSTEDQVKQIVDSLPGVENYHDGIAFIQSIACEIKGLKSARENISETINNVAKKRLLNLRKIATEELKIWATKRNELKSIIDPHFHINPIIKEIRKHSNSPKSAAWRNTRAKYFPRNQPDVFKHNILNIIWHEFNGVCPHYRFEGNGFWQNIYKDTIGLSEIQSYFVPSVRTLTAAAILILCESGMNISVCLALTKGCLAGSEIPNHTKVTGNKDRSNKKAIHTDLPNRIRNNELISSIEAIEMINEAIQETFRIDAKITSSLFSYILGGKLQPITEFTFRENFKTLIKESKYLSELELAPSMIRVTVLLITQLSNPNNIGVAQAIAAHESSQETFGYVSRMPFRIIKDKLMLKYTKALETVILTNSAQPISMLVSNEMNLPDRLSKIKRTGLGVFCKDSNFSTKENENLTCRSVQHCIKCNHDRMLVSADERSIADMILWKEALEQHEKEWLGTRYERWIEIWMPWLAFFTVVLDEKMTRGRLSFIKKKALSLARSIESSPQYKQRIPW